MFGFRLTAVEMERIASLDGGTSLFIDHRSPEVAAQVNGLKQG